MGEPRPSNESIQFGEPIEQQAWQPNSLVRRPPVPQSVERYVDAPVPGQTYQLAKDHLMGLDVLVPVSQPTPRSNYSMYDVADVPRPPMPQRHPQPSLITEQVPVERFSQAPVVPFIDEQDTPDEQAYEQEQVPPRTSKSRKVARAVLPFLVAGTAYMGGYKATMSQLCEPTIPVAGPIISFVTNFMPFDKDIACGRTAAGGQQNG